MELNILLKFKISHNPREGENRNEYNCNKFITLNRFGVCRFCLLETLMVLNSAKTSEWLPCSTL